MMSHSVGYALTWEYWRRGMFWFVPTLLGLAAGGILMVSRMHYSAGFRWTDVGAHLGPALVPFVLVMPLILALASWTALRRHYTLPVTTTVLVVWSLANGALATVGVYCCAAMFVNGVLHANWPLIVPALGSVAAYLAYQTALWCIGPSRGLIGLLAVAGFTSLVVAGWLSAGLPFLFEHVELWEDWRQVGAMGIVVWLGVVGSSYLLAVNGVARQRRGETWGWAWLIRRWAAVDTASRRSASPRDGTRFRSTASALFWFEWRTKGRWVPLYVTGILAGLWVCFGLLDMAPSVVSSILRSYTFLFLLASPLVGVYVGSRVNGFDLKPFTATRPVPDADLSAAVLRSAAAAVASAAVILLVGNLATLAVWVPYDWASLRFSWSSGGSAFFRAYGFDASMYVLGCWMMVGLGASLALCRQRFVCWAGLGFGGLLLSFVYGSELLPAGVLEALEAFVGAACFAATTAAFVAARRRKLVSVRAAFACLTGFLVLLVYLYLAVPVKEPPLVAHAIRIGFGITPFAPIPAAALAVAWNRHR